MLNAAGGDAAARVICRQLGMGGGAAREGGFFGGGALAPALTMVSCRGGEAALEGCSFGRAPADAGGEGFPAFGVACSGERAGGGQAVGCCIAGGVRTAL